jgi:hypothetical protein
MAGNRFIVGAVSIPSGFLVEHWGERLAQPIARRQRRLHRQTGNSRHHGWSARQPRGVGRTDRLAG